MEYLSVEENKAFAGTGENNSSGQNLDEFLKAYDPFRYKNPSSTVDTLVFTRKDDKIKRLLLIKRANHPSIGWWALPGGFVDFMEDTDKAAKRELMEETGIDNINIEQLKSYGAYNRDPRTRIITTAYVAIVDDSKALATAGDDAKDAAWFEIEDILIRRLNMGESTREEHRVSLMDIKTGNNPTAIVSKEYNNNAILDNVEYDVCNRNMLAADHGAIILEGYEYVSRKLREYYEKAKLETR